MASQPSQQYAYLDYAATAPLSKEALEALLPFFCDPMDGNIFDANPNSLHTPGRTAFQTLESARKRAAKALKAARPNEIIFTSSATESDCAAILGISQAAAEKRFPGWNQAKADIDTEDANKPHVIVSAIEHKAVSRPAKRLASQGFRVSYIKPDKHGFINPESLQALLDDATVLVSIQWANSEVGTVQPIPELAEIAHKAGALFHTDAVQALGKLPISLSDSMVDAASFSAHKIGGPKGVGLLYMKSDTPFNPQLLGGGQEFGKRSGTQNVPGICAFVAALETAVQIQPSESKRLCALRDRLYAYLSESSFFQQTCTPAVGDAASYLPNIVHLTTTALESETLIMKLDSMGFGVSGGSACASTSLKPSHVLTAMGIPADRAHGALRISFGRGTTSEEIDKLQSALSDIAEKVSPCN